jgi:hypothetical protein
MSHRVDSFPTFSNILRRDIIMGNQKQQKPLLLAGILDDKSRGFLSDFGYFDHSSHPNHHITLQFKCSVLAAAAFAGMEWRAPVFDVVTDGKAVVADIGEVEVLSAKFSADHEGMWMPIRPALEALGKITKKGRAGQDFHVTISHDETVKAVHSNEVLRKFREGGPLEATKVVDSSELEGVLVGGTIGWIDGGGGDHVSWETLKGFTPKLALAHCVGRSGVGSKPLAGLEKQLLADIGMLEPGFVVNGGTLNLSPEAMALTAPGIARNSDLSPEANFGDHDHRGELHRCVEISGDVTPTTRGGMCFVWGLGSVLVDGDSYRDADFDEKGIPNIITDLINSGAIYQGVSLQANPYEGNDPAPVTPKKHDRKVDAGEIPEDDKAREVCVEFHNEHTLVYYV